MWCVKYIVYYNEKLSHFEKQKMSITANLSIRNLIYIFPDQLSSDISSLENFDTEKDVILITENIEEFTHVKHHKKKIAFILSCMRAFGEELCLKGFRVFYSKLGDNNAKHSIEESIEYYKNSLKPKKVILTEPSEYRLLQKVEQLKKNSDIDITIMNDSRFLISNDEFKKWAYGKKKLVMEFFYRFMRIKHNILLDADKNPVGGKWNFDHENRKSPKEIPKVLKPLIFKPNDIAKSAIHDVEQLFAEHFGDIEPFEYAITAKDANKALQFFLDNYLDKFGENQDAMLVNQPFLYHSHISMYINIGLLNPLKVIKEVEAKYYTKKISINNIEGFIRQILGWREFIRGIYWLYMPKYQSLNFFKADNKLPQFYWSGETKMQCIKQTVSQTQKYAYAHHIQRLMITGNFALIAGVSVAEICEWYHIVYADAFEWVELPNTLGMSQYADGGVLATKPYASSGNYINKMSNYCKSCHYNVKTMLEENSCPYNALYWNFFIRNKEKLNDNLRVALTIKNIKNKTTDEIQRINQKANKLLDNLDNL